MATSYTPSGSCSYTLDNLENKIFIIPNDEFGTVNIDNEEAFVEDPQVTPYVVDGYGISYSEQSSLDGKYIFTKELKFSVIGYAPISTFGTDSHIVIKDKRGNYWLVNVDFPCDITYDFALGEGDYQTSFTFKCQSNFPTLLLKNNWGKIGEETCKPMKVFGIDSLKIIERKDTSLDTVAKKVYTFNGNDFVDVEFMNKTCSLQETFDGSKLTTKLSFNIPMSEYKSSWHYNVLEFMDNKYAAVLTARGGDMFYVGYNLGLVPQFELSASSQSDIITMNFTEVSNEGMTASNDISSDIVDSKVWKYIKTKNGINAYVCIDGNTAKYLLQEEQNADGSPTGRYKSLEGYESLFPNLNIIGTFSEEVTFENDSCASSYCQITTSIQPTVTVRSSSCDTNSFSATCDWSASTNADWITVSPSSGQGGTQYVVTICNSASTENKTAWIDFQSGANVFACRYDYVVPKQLISPSSATINCLAQQVVFNYDYQNCNISVIDLDERLTYRITDTQLIVDVPRNSSVYDTEEYEIVCEGCGDERMTITIYQDVTYERLVETNEIICVGSASHKAYQRYTGTTSSYTPTLTSELVIGETISSHDKRCEGYITRWKFDNNYYCEDGNKFQALEQEESWDSGSTWTKTGLSQLGDFVESASSFCNETVQYKWVLTDEWMCTNIMERMNEYIVTCTTVGGTSTQVLRAIYAKQESLDYGVTWEYIYPMETLVYDYEYYPPSCVSDRNYRVKFGDGTRATSSNPTPYTIQYCNGDSACTSLNRLDVSSRDLELPYPNAYDFKIGTQVTKIANLQGIQFKSIRETYDVDYVTYRPSLVIPSGITEMSNRCLANTNLKDVYFEGTTPPTNIGLGVFANCDDLENIYVPQSAVTTYKNNFMLRAYASKIKAIPNGVDIWQT